MKKIKIEAPAKINLILDVTGKMKDGYHNINTIFQTVSVFDYITITQNKDHDAGFKIICTDPNIPTDKKNICYKAAEMIENYIGIKFMQDITIEIEKNIPSEAGMGGGSVDAAAVLLGINRMLGVEIPQINLFNLARKCGADVPFFLQGGTALATGIGDILTPVENNSGYVPICIAKGKKGVSTALGYKAVDERKKPFSCNIEKLEDALRCGNIRGIADNLANIFTDSLNLPEVEKIKKIMLENDSFGAEMTGSGSAVFGIFRSFAEAEAAQKALSEMKFSKACLMGDYKIRFI